MTEHPDTVAVLRLICESGAITTRELESNMPHTDAVTRHLYTLKTGLLIDSDQVPSKTTNHSITAKGRRLLRMIDGAPLGDFPTPRRPVTGGTYTGEPAQAMREGSMRAYEIPSLGDTERKRPILMGAQPQVRV